MTIRAGARYVLGGVLFLVGLAFIVLIAKPDPKTVGLTMIGLALAYGGLDLLRIRPTDRRGLGDEADADGKSAGWTFTRASRDIPEH